MADLLANLQTARDEASCAFDRFCDLLVIVDSVDAALAAYGEAAPILAQARDLATQGRDAAARAVSTINKQVRN